MNRDAEFTMWNAVGFFEGNVGSRCAGWVHSDGMCGRCNVLNGEALDLDLNREPVVGVDVGVKNGRVQSMCIVDGGVRNALRVDVEGDVARSNDHGKCDVVAVFLESKGLCIGETDVYGFSGEDVGDRGGE